MCSFNQQQQTNSWSNLHNSCSPCNLGYERMNPFHQHQNYHLPNQMGDFIPQALHQDPSNPRFDPNPRYFNFPNYHPLIAPYETFTHMNQASLGGNSSPKKDRHTKISTAQGVRDRRVRLSMAVAREFFDLQDLLGFDKASSTIEWLLAKSKAAIQELVLKKHGSRLTRSTSNSPSSESDHEGGGGPFRKKRSRTLARPGSSSCKSPQDGIEKIIVDGVVDSNIARESRAKTRAKPRERTREKLYTMAPKPIDQFGDLGLQTSGKSAACSSQLLMDKQGCNAAPPRNLNGLNVITSKDSSPANSCTDYVQNLLSIYSTGDQDAPPNSLLGSNYNHPGDSSIFELFPDMYMSGKPWDNQFQQQVPQLARQLTD